MIKGSATVKDKDLGMKDLFKRLEAEENVVDIGIHSDEDQKLIVIAAANEFGATIEHPKGYTITIPPRPYIRSTVDENETKYQRVSKNLMGQMISKKMTKPMALEIMGQLIEGDIKRKIISLRSPPNAPSTIRAKGSDNPLVNTGLLGGSIRFVIKEES